MFLLGRILSGNPARPLAAEVVSEVAWILLEANRGGSLPTEGPTLGRILRRAERRVERDERTSRGSPIPFDAIPDRRPSPLDAARVREAAEDIRKIVATWPPDLAAFFLDVAENGTRFREAAATWLPKIRSRHQARRLWRALRATVLESIGRRSSP